MTKDKVTLAEHVADTHRNKERTGKVVTGDIVSGDVVAKEPEKTPDAADDKEKPEAEEGAGS